MEKPKACRCGGQYKKTPAPPKTQDGSRCYKCDRCGARIEQTANGYEFRDAAPVVVQAPAPAQPPPPPRPFYAR